MVDDLAGTVGRIEGILDLLGGDPQAGGPVAVDIQVDLRVLDLQVAGDVLQHRQTAHLQLEGGRLPVEFFRIRALQHKLVQGLGSGWLSSWIRGRIRMNIMIPGTAMTPSGAASG